MLFVSIIESFVEELRILAFPAFCQLVVAKRRPIPAWHSPILDLSR
jgi:hypothetical protein